MKGKPFQPSQLRRLGIKVLSGYSERQLARDEGISPSTARVMRLRFRDRGITTKDKLESMDDRQLASAIYGDEAAVDTDADAGVRRITIKRGIQQNPLVLIPDFEAAANRVLDTGRNKILEYQDYTERCESQGRLAMSRSTFYREIDKAIKILDPDAGRNSYMEQEHRWGNELQIDYIGRKFHVVDPVTHKDKALIVCEFCWAASCMTCGVFIEHADCRETSQALLAALRYFGRRPAILVCDNAKSMVLEHAAGHEAVLAPGFERLLSKLHIEIDANSPGSPRQKSEVEYAGRLIKERCLSRMKEGLPLSAREATQALQALIDRYINSAGFRNGGRGTPRKQLYERYEAPAARPLPEIMPEYCNFYKRIRVSRAYRVEIDGRKVSVPSSYAGKHVNVEVSGHTATIYTDTGDPVAVRDLSAAGPGGTVLDPADMPGKDRAVRESRLKYQSREDILGEAGAYGDDVCKLMGQILDRKGWINGKKACIWILNKFRSESCHAAEIAAACRKVRTEPPSKWNSYEVLRVLASILHEEGGLEEGAGEEPPCAAPGGLGQGSAAVKYTCMKGSGDKEEGK